LDGTCRRANRWVFCVARDTVKYSPSVYEIKKASFLVLHSRSVSIVRWLTTNRVRGCIERSTIRRGGIHAGYSQVDLKMLGKRQYSVLVIGISDEMPFVEF
jgi:hypothetical protein